MVVMNFVQISGFQLGMNEPLDFGSNHQCIRHDGYSVKYII